MALLFEPPRPGRGDYHAHVFAAGECHVENPMYVPDYDATVEDYLSALHAHGLSWGTIVQPSFLGHDNTFMIEAMKANPGYFRGVVCVDPEDPLASLGKLQEWHDVGVRGVRINHYTPPLPDLTGDDWMRFAQELADRDWFMQFFIDAEQLGVLSDYLRSLPCKVVIDHLGLPQDGDVSSHPLLALVDLPNLWVKASGAYRCAPGAAARMEGALRARGFENLVPGSDWPHTQFAGEPESAWTFFH